MRKLKLQMQLSLDGYVCGPNGEMDWMTYVIDSAGKNYVNQLIDTSSTILMGRKMAGGFMDYWTKAAADQTAPDNLFAKKMIDTPKVVFSKTLQSTDWVNTTLATGGLTDEINKLKNAEGKDILMYGGAGFAASLIEAGLIDEYYLLVNPTAIGTGKAIFTGRTELELIKATPFTTGKVALEYKPKKINL